MPRRAYALRVDANQQEIVSALEAIGVSVHVIGQPVDLMVGYRGRTGALEIKDGRKPPSAWVLTPQQKDFFRNFRGFKRVVFSVDDALQAIKEMIA